MQNHWVINNLTSALNKTSSLSQQQELHNQMYNCLQELLDANPYYNPYYKNVSLLLDLVSQVGRSCRQRHTDFDGFQHSSMPAHRCHSHITLTITMTICFP